MIGLGELILLAALAGIGIGRWFAFSRSPDEKKDE